MPAVVLLIDQKSTNSFQYQKNAGRKYSQNVLLAAERRLDDLTTAQI